MGLQNLINILQKYKIKFTLKRSLYNNNKVKQVNVNVYPVGDRATQRPVLSDFFKKPSNLLVRSQRGVPKAKESKYCK